MYVYTEGAVAEAGFITFVAENGTRKEPDYEIVCNIENRGAPGRRRKPLPLVEDAIMKWHEVRYAAKKAGTKPFDREPSKDWAASGGQRAGQGPPLLRLGLGGLPT